MFLDKVHKVIQDAMGVCYFEGGEGGGSGTGGGAGTGAGAGGGSSAGGGTGSGTPTVYDQAYVDKLRTDAANERTSRAAAESKVAEFEKAQRDAQEKADKEKGDWEKIAKDKEREAERERTKNQELQRKIDLTAINAEVKKITDALGMRADAAAKLEKLIDMDQVKIGADGTVQGAQEQLDALKNEMPFLFEAGGGSGSGGSGGAAGGGGAGDGRPGGAGPGRSGGTAATIDYRNRETVTASQHKSGWDGLGKK